MKTSLDKTGSDGMNIGPDYSSAYCVVTTDTDFVGHGMVRDCLVYMGLQDTVLTSPSDIYHWARE
jgi:hypothetical protein